jgi:hypothetical protein
LSLLRSLYFCLSSYNLYAVLFSPIRTTCPVDLILLVFIVLIIRGKEDDLCSFLSLYPSSIQISSSALSSQTLWFYIPLLLPDIKLRIQTEPQQKL